jgi:hypothetical protein
MSSSLTPLIWLADAARRGFDGDDPYGILAALDAFVADGGKGSLDDALGISPAVAREDALAQRDALLRTFFQRFSDRPKRDRAGAAYGALETYWRRKWPARRHIPEGSHEEGSLHRLCWEIFTAHPRLIGRRQFQNVVRGK